MAFSFPKLRLGKLFGGKAEELPAVETEQTTEESGLLGTGIQESTVYHTGATVASNFGVTGNALALGLEAISSDAENQQLLAELMKNPEVHQYLAGKFNLQPGQPVTPELFAALAKVNPEIAEDFEKFNAKSYDQAVKFGVSSASAIAAPYALAPLGLGGPIGMAAGFGAGWVGSMLAEQHYDENIACKTTNTLGVLHSLLTFKKMGCGLNSETLTTALLTKCDDTVQEKYEAQLRDLSGKSTARLEDALLAMMKADLVAKGAPNEQIGFTEEDQNLANAMRTILAGQKQEIDAQIGVKAGNATLQLSDKYLALINNGKLNLAEVMLEPLPMTAEKLDPLYVQLQTELQQQYAIRDAATSLQGCGVAMQPGAANIAPPAALPGGLPQLATMAGIPSFTS